MSVSHKWLLIGILTQVTLYHIYYPLYHQLIINSKMASMWWLPDGGFQKAVAEQVLALIISIILFKMNVLSMNPFLFLKPNCNGSFVSRISFKDDNLQLMIMSINFASADRTVTFR